MLFKVYFNMQSDNEILNSIWKSYHNKNRIAFCHNFAVPLLKWKSYTALVIAMHLTTLCVAKFKLHFNLL